MHRKTDSEHSWLGGARIDNWNVTWPFARLSVNEHQLFLKIMFCGTYSFVPDQVIQVEAYGKIPVIGKGVRIHHRHVGYPEKIVFWRLTGNPANIVHPIHSSGFGHP